MAAVVGGGREGLDLWCREQLTEDECVWGGGCTSDEVGRGAEGGGRFGECKERLGVLARVGAAEGEGKRRRKGCTSKAFRAFVCSIL